MKTTRKPRYVATITVDGTTRPLETASTYQATILDEAKHAALNGQPGTIARVTDTRTGWFIEYERGHGHQFFSRAGQNKAAA
jgi:hypothetical protein